MRMFPFGIHVAWGIGLVLAGVVLTNNPDKLGWALITLGVVVGLGAFIAQMRDELAERSEGARSVE
ncbi:hypothetical protein BCF74_10681 [Knoellia remsis]|uniref:Uncharacterized protein n=1 Tax=Knoellia remsis TaxID=407159 RepID=A0A2T0UTU7_9MICO|nr:hypothetical protein [Knoellia remsis]PRY61333.1 hypothetical protein BCF74_10681 [Knoellia remsis]